jgi:ABC-type uncharacterized transport system ATPase component
MFYHLPLNIDMVSRLSCTVMLQHLPVNIDMVVFPEPLGHNGPGKTTIMSMLTGKCWSIAVQERRLTMSMLRGNC